MARLRRERRGVKPTAEEMAAVLAFARRRNGHHRVASAGYQTVSLRDATSLRYDSSGVSIYRPTPAEQAAAQAWHDHCREHGYPTGPRADATGYPPRPGVKGAGDWVRVTWKQIDQAIDCEQLEFGFGGIA